MKNREFIVSVAIPAYNEEKNIARLIGDILRQKQTGWSLGSITLFDDGSADETAVRAKQAYPQVKIIASQTRAGKSHAIGTLLKACAGDIIIFYDADVRLQGRHGITEIVNAFKKDPEVMVAGGNVYPQEPATFIQRGIYATFKVFYKSKKNYNGGDNIFGCVGSCMAVRRPFADALRIPDIVCDDAYIYMSCVTEGHKFKYVDSARVRYKMALTLGDYLKQQFRGANAVPYLLRGYFGGRTAEEFRRSAPFYLKYVWQSWKADPPATTFIILLNIVTKPLVPFISRTYKSAFPMAQSTK